MYQIVLTKKKVNKQLIFFIFLTNDTNDNEEDHGQHHAHKPTGGRHVCTCVISRIYLLIFKFCVISRIYYSCISYYNYLPVLHNQRALRNKYKLEWPQMGFRDHHQRPRHGSHIQSRDQDHQLK